MLGAMANNKIDAPPPPVAWEMPEAPADSGSPDKSFHDDKVAAQIKSREAADLQGKDRFQGVPPRNILESHEKIEEAAPFRPTTEDNSETHRAKKNATVGPESKTTTKGRGPRQAAAASARGERGQAARTVAGEPDTEQVQERLRKLMDHLGALETQEAGQAARGQLPPGDMTALKQAAAAQRRQVELQIKDAFMQLVTTGFGAGLLADPRLAFKRLFDRFRRWPRGIRPGHRPQTDSDIDALIAWFFEPPQLPGDLP